MLAAVEVSQGPGCATVEAPGPSFPADVATKTPASAANRKATSTGSRKFVREPLIEKFRTSTPSSTAWSMAATLSELLQPPSEPTSSQQTLYMATRARGAMPLILPREAASPVACTPLLPPAVEVVWLP